MSEQVVVGISKDMAVRLANQASKLAQINAPKRTGKGARGLLPYADYGVFGIRIAPWADYMYYQEHGIKPFIMWSLEGKVIPMQINGQTIFRVASDVGGRQITNRDPKTGRIIKGNRPIKWRHPGLAPKNFIADAMEEVVQRNIELIKQDMYAQAIEMLDDMVVNSL